MRWPWQKEEPKKEGDAVDEPTKVAAAKERTARVLLEQRQALEDAARVGVIDLETETYNRGGPLNA